MPLGSPETFIKSAPPSSAIIIGSIAWPSQRIWSSGPLVGKSVSWAKGLTVMDPFKTCSVQLLPLVVTV